MDLRDLARLLQRQWLVVVGLAVVGALVAGVVSALATPSYRSTAQVFIAVDGGTTQDAYAASLYGSARIQSYAELARSRPVLERVVDEVGSADGAESLAGSITATVVEGTVIISVSAVGPTARRAAALTQADAEALTAYINAIERPVRTAARASGRARASRPPTQRAPVEASVVDPAEVPLRPETPRTGLNVAVAALLGLLVGLGVAVAREVLDSRPRTRQDVQDVLGAPVLARIPTGPEGDRDGRHTLLHPHPARPEAFRVLRANLQFLDPDDPPRSFVLTAATPGTGTSWTAVSLAVALAQADRRVLLVDADLRRPQLAGLLGLDSRQGLTSVVVGVDDLEASIQRHGPTGVHLLAAGPLPPNPAELLGTSAARAVLARVRDLYDVVVVDTPALLPVVDAALVAQHADGALLVTRHATTRRDALAEARGRLTAVGARLLGAVVLRAPRGAADTGAGPEPSSLGSGVLVLPRRETPRGA